MYSTVSTHAPPFPSFPSSFPSSVSSHSSFHTPSSHQPNTYADAASRLHPVPDLDFNRSWTSLPVPFSEDGRPSGTNMSSRAAGAGAGAYFPGPPSSAASQDAGGNLVWSAHPFANHSGAGGAPYGAYVYPDTSYGTQAQTGAGQGQGGRGGFGGSFGQYGNSTGQRYESTGTDVGGMASFAPAPTSSSAPSSKSTSTPRHAYFPTTTAPSSYPPNTNASHPPHAHSAASGFPPTSAGAQSPLAHAQGGAGAPYHPVKGEVGDVQGLDGAVGGEYAAYGGAGVGSPPKFASSVGVGAVEYEYAAADAGQAHRGGGAVPSRRIRDGGGGGGGGGAAGNGGHGAVGAIGAAGAGGTRKEFLCDICGKAFQTGGYLARHKKVHTADRPHTCPIPGCPSRFNRHDNMLQHWRSHARRVGDIPGIPRPPAPRMVVDLAGLTSTARANMNMNVNGNLRPDMIVVEHAAVGRRMHAAGGVGAGAGRGGAGQGGGGAYYGGEYGAATTQQQQQQRQEFEQAQYAQAQGDFGYLNVPTYTGPPTYPGTTNGTTDTARVGGSPVPPSEWSGSGYSGSSGTAQSGGLVRTISAASGGSASEGGQMYGGN